MIYWENTETGLGIPQIVLFPHNKSVERTVYERIFCRYTCASEQHVITLTFKKIAFKVIVQGTGITTVHSAVA